MIQQTKIDQKFAFLDHCKFKRQFLHEKKCPKFIDLSMSL